MAEVEIGICIKIPNDLYTFSKILEIFQQIKQNLCITDSEKKFFLIAKLIHKFTITVLFY